MLRVKIRVILVKVRIGFVLQLEFSVRIWLG